MDPPASKVSLYARLSEGNAWNMDAFSPIKGKDGIEVERGLGNHVSVEFNVLYRVSICIAIPPSAHRPGLSGIPLYPRRINNGRKTCSIGSLRTSHSTS
jgi:hypothetical protein